MAISPTAEGFRAAFRQPSLTLGEITWRWLVGATATLVFFFGLYHYLDSLPVNQGELLFLRSRQPYLVSEAIAHILRGSLGRVVLSGLLAAMLLGLLWMVAGAVGRIATVRALLDYFQQDVAGRISAASLADAGFTRGNGDANSREDINLKIAESGSANSFPALVRLNFLRVGVAIAAVVGVLGSSILAGFVSPDSNPRPGLAFLLFLPLAALVWLAWMTLNWLLSLAGLFAVRDGEDTVGAISAAVGFCRERTGAVAAVSVWTGLAHLVAFVAASTVISMPMGFAPLLPGRLVMLVMVLMTMAYFALADWLYMARLAGYVCIVETPEELMRPAPLPPIPLPPPRAVHPTPQSPVQRTIDRDELILSDVPGEPVLQSAIDRDELILSDLPATQEPAVQEPRSSGDHEHNDGSVI
jgi:hypothetical protein